jgi:hypothetical protein
VPDDEIETEAESRAADRLNLFSDAVVAIAIRCSPSSFRCPREARYTCSGLRSGTKPAIMPPS